MRIAIVYDCLYPSTVGGAERWLRVLAEELAVEHEVTYVTRRQWARGDAPEVPGVEVVAVSPRTGLYTKRGRRRLVTPVLFALGVFAHFALRRRRYDVVHCVSYPYLPLIGVRTALAGGRRTKVFCEWLEFLTPEYWRRYGGVVGGTAGRMVQALCLRLTPSAFVFSRLNERRLLAAGYDRELLRLTGLCADELGRAAAVERPASDGSGPLVLFSGRHMPDKQVTAIPAAIAVLRDREPGVRAVISGDGPERPRVLAEIARLGLEDVIETPGFVERALLDALLSSADCVVSPSIRDGHGMAVVEAAAFGVPAVVCDHPDSALTEHVVDGVTGAVARSAEPEELADAIARVLDGGPALRAQTAAWFAAHRESLAMSTSIAAVRRAYAPVPALSPSGDGAPQERHEERAVEAVDAAG